MKSSNRQYITERVLYIHPDNPERGEIEENYKSKVTKNTLRAEDSVETSQIERKTRKKIKKRFGISSPNIPLEELVEITTIDKVSKSEKEKIKDLLIAREKGHFKKNFNLGKVYANIPVSGVKEDYNLANLAQYLVYGLISRRPELVYEAEKIFDRKKLAEARKFISPKEIYRNVKDDLSEIEAFDDETNAYNILNFLKTRYKNVTAINDLLDGIAESKIDYILVKMQDGTLHDLFNDNRLSTCTFYPNGGNQEDALNYALDKNIALLHLVPIKRKKILPPSGVAILMKAEDKKHREGILIDSYEQGNELKLAKRIWIPAVLKGIKNMARDHKAEFIMFNRKSFSSANESLVKYLSRKLNYRVKEEYMRKTGGDRFLEKYSRSGRHFQFLESFKERDQLEGIVKGIKITIEK